MERKKEKHPMAIEILAADDSESIRQMVVFSLKREGFSVVEAADGAEALEKARENPFHLVITDLDMPRMNGIQLVQELRKLAGYGKTPILLLTTESDAGLKKEARSAGASGWIIKPFRPDQLVATVQKLLPADHD
jgi:two-component system chemotaxis response regulator CheY